MARPKKGTTPEQRFWERVNKTETCWLWTGHTRGGYGRMMIGGQKNYTVHRYSWELHNGPIDEGSDVLHTCDVRNCVYPGHLYLGTDVENSQDRVDRDRSKQGISILPCPRCGAEFNEDNFGVYWRPKAKKGPQWQRACLVCARERARKSRLKK